MKYFNQLFIKWLIKIQKIEIILNKYINIYINWKINNNLKKNLILNLDNY